MNDSKKIEYYDLREEASAGSLPYLIGRGGELERLDRVVGRRRSNNALIVGPSGIGKTAFVHGWAKRATRMPIYDAYTFVQLSAEHIALYENDETLEERYAGALSLLPACILFIDDFGREMHRNTMLAQRLYRLYKQLLAHPSVHVILALEPADLVWLEREYPAFTHAFEVIHLKARSSFEHLRVLSRVLPRLNTRSAIVPDTVLSDIVAHSEHFPALGHMPGSAVRLLDESIAFSAAKDEPVLTESTVAEVVESKTGVPRAQLTRDELEGVKKLAAELNARIVNQTRAIGKIASTLQRAKLGLRSPHRPLGSFLLLGPSGVGKTETAKCVAEIMFGRSESFVRFDMSEFQQEHTAQRLIGAPAGYIGYEEGGALVNALKKNPYSLILLDEIEKAHPKVFDIFLQVLDDGRLTSGQNETVDARNTIIMATSNAAVSEILHAYESMEEGTDDSFVKEKIMPALTKTFRLEFINRFDNILVFNPLSESDLLRIARLEIEKLERRVAKHRVHFDIDPEVLAGQIRHMADPRFGARPVKRFIEETCETLLAESLLHAHAV